MEVIDYEGNTSEFEIPDTALTERAVLSDNDVITLVDALVLPFIEILTGTKLFDYQLEVARSICYGVISGNGWTFSVVQARQSGKSEMIACVVLVLGMLIPTFCENFKAEQFDKFRKAGFMVGVYGPDYDKASIIYDRIKAKANSPEAQRVFKDPEFNINMKEVKGLHFPNGFKVDMRTAKKGSNIEGKTYHLIVIDEAQDVDELIITKSIRPMKNFYRGNLVMIGTPRPQIVYFKEALDKARARDLKMKRKTLREYHEYDYYYVADCNPHYKESIGDEMLEIGEDSDAFRLAYKLEWIDTSGRFIPKSDLMACGIRSTTEKSVTISKMGKDFESTFTLSSGTISSSDETGVVFSIDYAKTSDTTVLTFARVWWDNPISIGGDQIRYRSHILDWRTFKGDYEQQFEAIVDAILQYDCIMGIDDATGVGDPIHSRLQARLAQYDIRLHPFVFSVRSKHEGYSLWLQELLAGRHTFPAAEYLKTYHKYKEFVLQTHELTKEYHNQYMKVSHPDGRDKHDDFPDSAMMLCWLINKEGPGIMYVSENPLRQLKRFTDKYKPGKRTPDGKSHRRKQWWKR